MQLTSDHDVPDPQSRIQSPGNAAEDKDVGRISVDQHLGRGSGADGAHAAFGHDQSDATVRSDTHVDPTVPFMGRVLDPLEEWLGFLGERALHSHSDGVVHKRRFCAKAQTMGKGAPY